MFVIDRTNPVTQEAGKCLLSRGYFNIPLSHTIIVYDTSKGPQYVFVPQTFNSVTSIDVSELEIFANPHVDLSVLSSKMPGQKLRYFLRSFRFIITFN